MVTIEYEFIYSENCKTYNDILTIYKYVRHMITPSS